jgi:hypothetical protein
MLLKDKCKLESLRGTTWLLAQSGQVASDILEMSLGNTGLLYSVNNNYVCINVVHVKFEVLTMTMKVIWVLRCDTM